MIRLFMHAVKKDATHLLFTVVAQRVAQIAETIMEFWKSKTNNRLIIHAHPCPAARNKLQR